MQAAGVSVICTSATLALAGDMGPFAAGIGAGSARAEVVGSPFDFELNMRVFTAADIPLPTQPDSRRRRISALSIRSYPGAHLSASRPRSHII